MKHLADLFISPFRKAYIQEQVQSFLAVAPRNTILLSIFEWADSGLRVIDDTRVLLRNRILTPAVDCVSSRTFAIRHELIRGNIHSAKAAFEQAVRSEECKWNCSLWISYIRFCASNRELRSKARDVFYRALRHCPWSKDIMMEAFGSLIRDMKSEDLRSVYETMTSKGLRVHVDMEDFMEKRRADASKGQRK